MRYRTALRCVWLFFLFHNLEEAVAIRSLPRPRAATLPAPLGELEARLTYPTMLTALAAVTMAALAIVLIADRRRESSGARWAVLVLQATVGVSALTHVAAATVFFRGYSPGLITALLLNAPFTLYLIRLASRERWVSPVALWMALPTAFVLAGPGLLGLLLLFARFT